MANIDMAMAKFDGFPGYFGNPPSNEAEFNALFSGDGVWVNKPTWAEVQAELQKIEFQKNRASAYPSIQEQLDLLYWDKVNGTDNWEQAIAAVKAEYPKG